MNSNSILAIRSYTHNYLEYSHLLPMESKDVAFLHLNENKWLLKEFFIASTSITGVMEFLINRSPHFTKFLDHVLVDHIVRNNFSITTPLIMAPVLVSVSPHDCQLLGEMLADLALAKSNWFSMTYYAQSGVSQATVVDSIRVARSCGIIIRYLQEQDLHITSSFMRLGLQATYNVDDYFSTPENLNGIGPESKKLLHNYKETLRKVISCQQLHDWEQRREPVEEFTKTLEFLRY